MPRGDGTGPMGMGPMTGRAAGFCAGYMNPLPGRGAGMGLGRGSRGCGGGRGPSTGLRAGWRNMFYATRLPGWARTDMPDTVTPVPEQELTVLKQQADQFSSALEGIRKRIQELESVSVEK